MFTAKSQVDDKVIGYEVGADDYLTKPIHPMELVAHVRSLLGRGKARATGPIQRGYTIGVVSPKGGLGASSLTLNLGISYYLETRKDVVSAELRPGHGSWASELGFRGVNGLSNLLRMDPGEIVPSTVRESADAHNLWDAAAHRFKPHGRHKSFRLFCSVPGDCRATAISYPTGANRFWHLHFTQYGQLIKPMR
jgi:hypothetical protein